ncbi:transporter suffix domain-containing protein [Paenibacillus sp.]|uniref:transporter suffix domain-containing protein n=1 Tax=Paenibacillus sp. TaxID=58172 RepID=UPI002D70AA42|nr:transporter suffix domain-containing protein [Paenibacillus sp.]HZG86822.1 transporter suffix domain-containing protein [Paenibacillus sp.]
MAKRIGIFCIVLSFALYALLLAVPFLPAGSSGKAGAAAALVIAGEVAFWIGGLLLGREVIKKYRRFLSPAAWAKRKSAETQGEKEQT